MGFLVVSSIVIDTMIPCQKNGRLYCEWYSSCGDSLFDLPVPIVTSEVLVQVLINLIENSIKFGAAQPEKCIPKGSRGKPHLSLLISNAPFLKPETGARLRVRAEISSAF
jgi:signal transduction histidine kinase